MALMDPLKQAKGRSQLIVNLLDTLDGIRVYNCVGNGLNMTLVPIFADWSPVKPQS